HGRYHASPQWAWDPSGDHEACRHSGWDASSGSAQQAARTRPDALAFVTSSASRSDSCPWVEPLGYARRAHRPALGRARLPMATATPTCLPSRPIDFIGGLLPVSVRGGTYHRSLDGPPSGGS